jgi:hypothetical protein
MKKSIYFFFGILLVCGIYQACTPEEIPGSIYGVVADKATGEPIKSAGVELSPGGLKTITGSEGQFQFDNIAQGSYTLLITKTGYSDYASSTITVQPSQTTKVDVQIEKLPPALKVVNDHREDMDTLDFGSAEADVARSFNLFNDGTESLEWQITVTAEWIKSVSKIEGVLSAGATQSLIVTIDRTKLKSGENTTTAHITSNNGSKQLTITATNSTVLATLNTLPATNVKTTTATLNGEILTDGSPKYSERGFVYSESSMPTLSSCIQKITSTLTDSKTYSATVAGLTKGKTYYVRAYAINAGKEAYSTNEISFTPSDALPQVSTQAVTNISRTAGKATFNGKIVDAGEPEYTERGFVYATTHNPMVESDTKVVASGKGTGEFVANATGLVVGNTYYARAYATNTQGTAYGEEVVADFKAIAPEVTTVSVDVKTNTSAYFIGKITNVGDPEYTERGFIYAKIQNPTLDDASVTKVTVAKTSSAQFEKQVTITDLDQTVFYVRAYAKSSAGVSYGAIVKLDASKYLEYIQLPTFMHDNATYRVAPEFDIKCIDWYQATSMCENLIHGGYSDWVVPTKEELNTMYINRAKIGGFKNTSYSSSTTYYAYWSSTETENSIYAWIQFWDNGSQSTDKKEKQYYSFSNYTYAYYRVRCVRREN